MVKEAARCIPNRIISLNRTSYEKDVFVHMRKKPNVLKLIAQRKTSFRKPQIRNLVVSSIEIYINI